MPDQPSVPPMPEKVIVNIKDINEANAGDVLGIAFNPREFTFVGSNRKWIPTSERLPDIQDEYLVTITEKNKVIGVDAASFHLDDLGYIDGMWDTVIDWIEGPSEDYHVIAWRPMPEPYKAESEDKS